MSPGPVRPTCSRAASGGTYDLLYNKYWVDEVYDATIVEPTVDGSTSVLWRGVDAGLIDGIVNGIGRRSRGIGEYSPALAVGEHPQLRRLGGARIDLRDRGDDPAGRAPMNLLDVVVFLPLHRFSGDPVPAERTLRARSG